MRRLPLTSLLVALLAVSGGWAAPLRAADSGRLISAIVWLDRRDAETKQIAAERPARIRLSSVQGAPPNAPVLVTRDLPHALEQRPPPIAVAD